MSLKPNNLATMNTVKNNFNILNSGEENHLNIHESYLEIEFIVSVNGGGIISNDANVRVVNYGVMPLFKSIRLDTINGIGGKQLNV